MTDAIVPRHAEANELMPDDYFVRLEKSQIFDEERPLEVDLGCGDGGFLLGMAAHYDAHHFLGVERLLGRVRKVCKRAQRENLSNLKVLRLESRYTLEWLLPPNSVHRLHLLCPDPWPKVRHHRRRLIQPNFLEAALQALEPGGEFLFKTDHDEYFEHSLEVVNEFGKFQQLAWPEDAFFILRQIFRSNGKVKGNVCRHSA